MKSRRLIVWLVLWTGIAVAGLASFGCPLIGTNNACPEPLDLKLWVIGFLIGPYILARSAFEGLSMSADLSHLLAAICLGLFYGGWVFSFSRPAK